MIDHKRLIEIEISKDYIKFEGSKNNIFYFDNIHFILEENRISRQITKQKYKIRKEQEISKIEKNIVQNIEEFFKLLLINFKKISLYYDMHLKFKKFQEELYVFLKNKENLQE